MERSWESRGDGEVSSMLLQVDSIVDLVADRGIKPCGRPRMVCSSADRMPHSRAMAQAVVLLSPALQRQSG